ncbi:hypothetical protein OF820_13540 [Oceanotoga sp. DSM 15011]|uniref:hypothetical protein n=1 Tax=Oceanotoga sp. DSM 15011 TaxID=2984951 RepID=UPI0021F44B75|nr:hypothetical protein [Oceanotoga sp. DSM 15011]UYP00054.1 hypothetical protein OF820_13540 [Oceanotoga sp. DSM 15011]
MKKFLFFVFLISFSMILVSCSIQTSEVNEVNSIDSSKGNDYIIDENNFFYITFVISSIPSETNENDDIYIMGNFNNWFPGDENYRMTKNSDDSYSLKVKVVPNKEIKYKYNLGTFNSIEKDFFGNERSNRIFIPRFNDDIVDDQIEAW